MDKKRKGVYVEMSERELEQYRKAKGDKTHRETLLHGAGISLIEDKRIGPPSAEDMVRRANEVNQAHARQEIRDRMNAHVRAFNSDEATKVTCPRCGTSWTCRLPTPRQIECHVCGEIIDLAGSVKQPTEKLDAPTDALRRTNADRRRRTEDETRRTIYAKVDAEYDSVMGKMRGGSFKFDKNAKTEWQLLAQHLGNAGAPHSLSELTMATFGMTEPEWEKMAEKEKNVLMAKLLQLRPELQGKYLPKNWKDL